MQTRRTYKQKLSYMGVSENGGTPKSSILIGFSIINHPFWGTPIFGNIHINKTGLHQGFKAPKPRNILEPLDWITTFCHGHISLKLLITQLT